MDKIKHFSGSALDREYDSPLTHAVEFTSEGFLCLSGVNDSEGYRYQEFEW
jgi:hypothetical protein